MCRTALVLLTVSLGCTLGLQQFPLRRDTMGRTTLLLLAACLGCTLALQKFPMRMSSRSSIRKNAAQPVTPVTPKFAPQVRLNIGNPPQTRYFSIDTASGDSFIVDYAANPQPNRAPWQYTVNSTTLVNSSIAYIGDVLDQNGYAAHITGTVVTERFVINDHSFQMKVALIESVSTYVKPTTRVLVPDVFATGRLGFGLHATDNLDLFLLKLIEPQADSNKSFGLVDHECMIDINSEVDIGEFTVGGVDEKYCNVSTTIDVPIREVKAWNFDIDSVTVGNLSLTFKQMATVNIAEMLTGVPQQVYDFISKIGDASVVPEYQWPFVNCNANYPTLEFSVGEKKVRLTEEFYIFRDFETMHQPCHLMLYPLSGGGGFLPSWSLGYQAIYQKCMLFDYGRRTISFMDHSDGICENYKS